MSVNNKSEEKFEKKSGDITAAFPDRFKKTAAGLIHNGIDVYFAETCEDAVQTVKRIVPEGSTVTCGGSVSLAESGVYDLIKSERYRFLDRSMVTDERSSNEFYSKAYVADAFFCSSNAVTEQGILYNVDGNSNRISMIAHGPSSVIMIVGKNKIVPDLDAAINRVKTVAAPKNCKRLGIKTYCSEHGECVSLLKPSSELYEGCNTICCNYLVSAKQQKRGRIKVILVNRDLGY